MIGTYYLYCLSEEGGMTDEKQSRHSNGHAFQTHSHTLFAVTNAVAPVVPDHKRMATRCQVGLREASIHRFPRNTMDPYTGE